VTAASELARARDDLAWLSAHGALAGVAAIIAERRAMAERGDPPPREYAAEGALNFGETAQAGALCAAELDQEDPK
jgi:hypothetical protein